MSMEPPASSSETTPRLVPRWGPAIIRAQSLQLARSFPLTFGAALACVALATFLALAVHWLWAACALVASVWVGRRAESLQEPFLIQPLHPALVRDAASCELLVLVGIVERSGELFVQVGRTFDTHSMPWLRRYRNGEELTVALVEHDAGVARAVRVEAVTADRAALHAARDSIPEQARRLLELANASFDTSQQSPVREIALGPGTLLLEPERRSLEPAPVPAAPREPYRAFAGLAEQGALPFTPELAEIVAAARRIQLRLAGVTLVFALIGPLCLALAFGGAADAAYPPALGATGVLGSALTAPLLWAVFDRMRLARRYAADAEAGTLALFSGRITVHEAAFSDPQQVWLLDRRLLDPDPLRVQSVGIGHSTRRVWMANDRPVKELLIAHVALLAPVPDDADDIPLAPFSAEHVPAGFRVKSRALTHEEREELGRHIKRLQRIGTGNSFVLLGLLLMAGVFSWAGTVPWTGAHPILMLAYIGWFGILVTALLRQRAASALRRDLATGRCIVLLPSYSESLAHPELRAEHLPQSRKAWSIMGRPAAWRGTQY